MVDGYVFTDFFRRMMFHLVDDINNEKYNRFCTNGFEDYDYSDGIDCAYNVARALAESFDYLKTNISPNHQDWKWSRFHYNDYSYSPWSLTPLKFLFHREVPTAGNG